MTGRVGPPGPSARGGAPGACHRRRATRSKGTPAWSHLHSAHPANFGEPRSAQANSGAGRQRYEARAKIAWSRGDRHHREWEKSLTLPTTVDGIGEIDTNAGGNVAIKGNKIAQIW